MSSGAVAVLMGAALSSPSNTTERYTFATNAVAAGGNMTYSNRYTSSFSTNTVGYAGSGSDGVSAALKTFNKYTYATNVFAATASLTFARQMSGAACNSSKGIVAGGATDGSGTATVYSSTEVLTIATDTFAAGTNLTAPRNTLSAQFSTNPGHL